MSNVNKYQTQAISIINKTKKWLEEGGKTWVAFGVIGIISVVILSSFIKFQPREKVEESNNVTTQETVINPLAFSGFEIDDESITNKRVQVSNKTEGSKNDIIELEGENYLIEVQTQEVIQSGANTGFNPTIAETISSDAPIKQLDSLFDSNIAFIRDNARDQEQKLAYTLLDVSSEQAINEFYVYNIEFPFYPDTNQFNEGVTKSRITVFIDPEGQIQRYTPSIIDNLNSLKRIPRLQIFSDSSSNINQDKIDDEYQNVQSNKLKYALQIPEGYELVENNTRLDGLDIIEIKNDTATIKLTRKNSSGRPIENTNLVSISSDISRDAQVIGIKDYQYTLKTYGNKGKNSLINLGDQSPLASNISVEYLINTDLNVEDIKSQIKELDSIVGTIKNNSIPTNRGCDQLIGQKIPFKSPLCGNDLEYTQINQNFGDDHQALDIVANETYYQSNKDYELDQKEYFYATCDGEMKNTQDKETLANVITITCENNGYTVQYWHDQESFWNYTGSVKAGDAIGVVGNTGNSDGRHIHYIIEKDGQRVDPLQFIKN